MRRLGVVVATTILVATSAGCSRPDDAGGGKPTEVSTSAQTDTADNGASTDDGASTTEPPAPVGASDTSPATPPPVGAAVALTQADFMNISVPSFCDHPAGTLTDGELELTSPDGSDPGYLVLNGVEPGQLDDDPDYEYVVVFGCSQGGVSWPDLVTLYDSDQTLITHFSLADMYDVGPWRGGVGFRWDPDARLFFGDVFYEVSGTLGFESWSVIESPTCTIAYDPESAELVAFNPSGGDAVCRQGSDWGAYQQAAVGAGSGTTVDLVTGETVDAAAGQSGSGDSSSSGGGRTPGAPDPAAIACDSAEEVFTNYLLAAGARDYSSAWAFLAQSDKDDYGSFERFATFWDTVSVAGIEEERPLGSSSGAASTEYIMFYDIDTGRQYERVEVDTTCTNGISKIADYRFKEIVDY